MALDSITAGYTPPLCRLPFSQHVVFSLSLGFGVTAHAVVFLSARISFLAASRAAFDVMERGLTLIPIDISSRQDSSYTHRRFDTQVTSFNI